MEFRAVEENLRQSFRVLATGRPAADVSELRGVTIASLGAQFQMFNAAFLSAPVETVEELEERVETARAHFAARAMDWSFWFCQDWLASGARRKLSRACQGAGLRLCAEMPGMVAAEIRKPGRRLPEMEFRRVVRGQEVEDFRAVGATCFHVPLGWFSEVFDHDMARRAEFVCWVGYVGGEPVATAATVRAPAAVIGVYNVATAPAHRGRGYGESITRYAIDAARASSADGSDAARASRAGGSGAARLGNDRVILQSTSHGYGLYQRMGFGEVTRIVVYNSVPLTQRTNGGQSA